MTARRSDSEASAGSLDEILHELERIGEVASAISKGVMVVDPAAMAAAEKIAKQLSDEGGWAQISASYLDSFAAQAEAAADSLKVPDSLHLYPGASRYLGTGHTYAALPASASASAEGVTAQSTTDDVWGPVVSGEEAARLEQANIQLQVAQRRQQLDVSFTRAQAADLLGISAQTVSEWVAQHRLVGLKDGREWRFPAWQFTPDNAEPVLPDLRRLVDSFPGGVVSLSRWMSRPNDNFGGRTPAQEMVRDSDHVFAIVETLAAA